MNTKGTLKYRKVEPTPQVGKNAGQKKYYATAVQDRTMDFEAFVDHIADHGSPFSRGTVHGVLKDALDCLQELILDGKSVRLGDLGLFSIGMTSQGEASPDKVTSQSITGVHLICRNTKSWSNAELRKKCRIELFDGKVVIEGSSAPTTPSKPSQGGGSPSQGGGSTQNPGTTDPNPSGPSGDGDESE